MNYDPGTFETLEIYLAAFLSLNEQAPEIVVPEGEHKVFFIFDRQAPGFYEVLNEYYNKNTTVDLGRYIREVKYLRGQMHQARHKEGVDER